MRINSLINLSNALSLMRAPLACVFFLTTSNLRFVAIILAMLTDILDGYFARKFFTITTLGRILDPLMDKLFVLIIVIVFYQEKTLSGEHILCLFCRDIGTLVFSIGLYFSSSWKAYRIRPFSAGKVSTAMQFIVLTLLTLSITIPSWVYSLFIFGGLVNFIQLYLHAKRIKKYALQIHS